MTIILLHFISVESLRVSHLALTVNTLTLCSTLRYSAQYSHFERKFMSIFFRSGKNIAEGVHINKTNHFFIFDAFGMPHQLYDLINSRDELKYTTDFLDRIDQFSLLCVWPSR